MLGANVDFGNEYKLELEKAMTLHSSSLAWKIPWMEEPGRLQSMGSLRVRHDWATLLSRFPFMHWRRKWQPIPVFLPGESQGWGSLVDCRLWGRRVGHDWSDLAAAQAGVRADLRLSGTHTAPNRFRDHPRNIGWLWCGFLWVFWAVACCFHQQSWGFVFCAVWLVRSCC